MVVESTIVVISVVGHGKVIVAIEALNFRSTIVPHLCDSFLCVLTRFIHCLPDTIKQLHCN
jgi:hypothetical protein